MTIRFTDIDKATSGAGDFIIRQRYPSVTQLVALFLSAFLIAVSVSVAVNNMFYLTVMLLILLFMVGWYAIVQIQRNRDLTLMTEFQNAVFTSALGAQSLFCLVVNYNGTIIYLDRSFQNVFSDFLKQPHHTLESLLRYGQVAKEDADKIHAAIQKNERDNIVLKIRTSDGEFHKVALSIEPIERPAGFILLRSHDYVENRTEEATTPYFQATWQNQAAVNKPVSTEPASPAAEALRNSFIESSPIAIAKLDNDGRITEGNRAFHELTQHTLATHLPVSFMDMLAADRKGEAEIIFGKAFGGQVPVDAQSFDITLPNGVELIISAYFSLVDGGASGQLLIMHLIDITEQKNLELRFSHSQKMQAVGQLAGGVAHDFNNLLTAMIGFCDLLLMRHPAGDQSFADIMQIKQNANRAANLVRQLLAFSRRQTLQPKVLDLTDVLAELSNLIRRLIGENIELKMVHGRDIGHVRADQGQLEQVLINLAVNARDAMPSGGALTIATRKTTIDRKHPLPRDLIAPAEEDTTIPNGEYVLVEVIDTGTGIPKAILQKIFEPFFSTKAVGSGTGLGLSTVYGIIKQTGGYVYVSSKENEGTNFSMYFPSVAAQEVAAAAAAVESETSDKGAPADLTGNCTILLVEDETPVRIFAARALRNKGYTILEADCAETAITLMANQGNDVEVIVTDVIMPGMNGPTMIDKLIPQYPNVKVIFISGYAEDVFVNNYGSERSFNFLAKPFTLKQLASKIKEVTGK